MTIFMIYPYGAYGIALFFSDYDGLMIHTEKGYIAMGGGVLEKIVRWSSTKITDLHRSVAHKHADHVLL